MKGSSNVRARAFAAVCGCLLLATTAFAETEAMELKVGDAAPGFTLTGSDGAEYSLEQFNGKKAVVLAFFPKALTPG